MQWIEALGDLGAALSREIADASASRLSVDGIKPFSRRKSVRAGERLSRDATRRRTEAVPQSNEGLH